MRQWGMFEEVVQPDHRRYVRAYWRFLLGWQKPPPRTTVPTDVGEHLREVAKNEVLEYRRLAAEAGGAQIIDLDSNEPPPSPAKAA